MKRTMLSLVATLFVAMPSLAPAAAPDWSRVADALGKSGQEMPGGVYRVGLPRTDLHVTLDGVEIKPGLALGSWLAFKPMGDEAMVMGDLVLTVPEVSPVLSKLQQGSIEVTGLHNHLLRNEPFTMYMHVLGHGDPVKLATALHAALAESKTPLGTAAPASAADLGFDPAVIDRALGRSGKANGPVYAVSVPRAKPVTEAGTEIPEAMGSANAINFQGTGGGKVATTGDFVLIGSEVNPVATALREHRIEVTAIHNHMLGDEPRLFFMHFWANDDAQKVATGLRAALDRVDVEKAK